MSLFAIFVLYFNTTDAVQPIQERGGVEGVHSHHLGDEGAHPRLCVIYVRVDYGRKRRHQLKHGRVRVGRTASRFVIGQAGGIDVGSRSGYAVRLNLRRIGGMDPGNARPLGVDAPPSGSQSRPLVLVVFPFVVGRRGGQLARSLFQVAHEQAKPHREGLPSKQHYASSIVRRCRRGRRCRCCRPAAAAKINQAQNAADVLRVVGRTASSLLRFTAG
mmetsp:Transcript_1635/g.3584  ORF Transcript_1635/g.3584 Transcript_1635/m.3584 type:complete len:217 (+) Transcript_1635:2029-2679(+)